MRFVLLCFYIGVVFLTFSCGTTKIAQSTPLVHPENNSEEKDTTISLEDSLRRDNTLQDSLIKNDTVQPVVNTHLNLGPLEKQRQSGFYKSADFAQAMHYDLRRPNYVIIHHTSQNSLAQTLRTFQLPHTKVSAHYVIGKDGQVVQLLSDYDRAWHAGKSKWGSLTDINSASIGIELDNNGFDEFPDEQISSLLILLDTLKTKYLIPQLNFIGHADIAPTRKNDPNIHFPWKKLAEHGFGIWYNEDFLPDPPANFNPIDALKIMGYDMKYPESSIEAFKRKYIRKEVNKVLTDYDVKVLYDLYRRYY